MLRLLAVQARAAAQVPEFVEPAGRLAMGPENDRAREEAQQCRARRGVESEAAPLQARHG
jgi:hypothetical protein